MEKKIERVPYISKWYKEEQKDELLHFAFDAQNSGSNWDVDKYYTTTTVICSKPTSPTLKFEHHLTQKDVDYLRELLYLISLDVQAIKNVPSREKEALDRLLIITNYIRNAFGVRDKAQEKQLQELIEQSKPKKSYEGTLGEHKEELQKLYQIKEQCGLKFIKDFANGNFPYSITLSPIKEILGIDFIKDFIKACEKCED